jgi:hypothetical protein
MSGTRSPSKTAPATSRHGLWKLGALVWPFVTAALAINLFMLGLLLQAVGLPAFPPVTALWVSLPLGLPVSWVAARWIRRLIDTAERG